MDLSSLSPEEKQALLEALQQEGQDPVQALCEVVAMLAEKLDSAMERLGKLEGLVVDEIIGGLDGLYQDNLRVEGIKGLKGKYGELFGPHEGTFKELYDADVYEKLFDMLEGMKGEEGFSEEAGDTKVKGLAAQMAEKFGKLKAPPAEPEKPAAVEVAKVAVEEDPMKPLIAGIQRMKKRGRVPGVAGEPRD